MRSISRLRSDDDGRVVVRTVTVRSGDVITRTGVRMQRTGVDT